MQVWQKLEEQNPDFFKAYITRLKLKDQINLFNHLLEQQIQVSSSLCKCSCSLACQGGKPGWQYGCPCQLCVHEPRLLQLICMGRMELWHTESVLQQSWVARGITPALALLYKVTWWLCGAAGFG